MRVTTLNLRGFFDWDQRLPVIRAYLEQHRPRLVLCQEVVYLPEVAARTNAALLADALGAPNRAIDVARLQQSPQFGLYREGLAAFGDAAIVAAETLVLRHEEVDPHLRLVQLLDVRDDDGTLWRFANLHLSVRDDFALEQLREMVALLDARGERRILAGDFNVNRLGRYRRIWGEGWTLSTDLRDYDSHPGNRQSNDYFLVPDEIELAALDVSPDGLSDHRALTADLRHRQPPPAA